MLSDVRHSHSFTLAVWVKQDGQVRWHEFFTARTGAGGGVCGGVQYCYSRRVRLVLLLLLTRSRIATADGGRAVGDHALDQDREGLLVRDLISYVASLCNSF